MMPLLLAAAGLLAGDLYLSDADRHARAILDGTPPFESAARIASDLARAQHHLKEAPPELGERLRAAWVASEKLQATLAHEDSADVRAQVESVLAELILARQALASAEQAAGVTELARVQPPLRQR